VTDVDRIERALRAGPADEPRYIPGTFRNRRPRGYLRSALLAAGVIASVTVGVVIGLGLGAARPVGGLIGGPQDSAAALQGHWISQGMSLRAWTDALLVKGNRQEDIDAFLVHDPFRSTIHYEIDVTEDRILISSVADDGPLAPLSGGPFQLIGPSTFRYDDVGCYVTVDFEVAGQWLNFDPPAMDSCNADERIANTAFFNSWPYTRGEPR
jgi:hypothetical protein